ncbi:MAG TPA: hypothetical protein ENJ00_00815 [Phycisphaerales bacterium]|nr:hypothetical protein [Phycisphaerales bacterium]
MWEPSEIRVVRWFMRFAGVGLLVPGLIYAMSWPDTVRAVSLCTSESAGPVVVGAMVVLLVFGGLSFVFARLGRYGAVSAAVALLMGSWVHWQWSQMMQARLSKLPEGLTDADRAMIEDTILFAANAQIPHIMKNLVLVGVCVVVFVLGPRLCGSRVRGVVDPHP